jgi:hypothetical protein
MRRHTPPKTKSAVIGLFLLSCWLVLCAVPAAADEWKVGDVILGTPGGQIEVVDSAGNVIDSSVSLGTGGRVGGCAPDSSYRIRCVDFDHSKVVKFMLQDPHTPTQPPLPVSSTLGNPQSILYVGSNNDFVLGYAGGLVRRYGYNGNLLKSCGPVSTDAASTFWMDVFGDANQTIVYTSGVGNGSKATLRKLTISPTTCGTVSTIFTVKLLSGQAFYGVRALPNSSHIVDGSGGYVIAVGTDILQLSSSGTITRHFAAAAGEVTNDWRAVALSPDRASFWSVNLATGHLFEFNLSNGTVQAGAISTSAGSGDDVGGIAVEGGDDAAQPTVQTASFTLDAPGFGSRTGSATFCDNPAPAPCGSVNPNKVTITLNASNQEVITTFFVRFTEVDPVAGKSDNGLDCALASQDDTKCVIWEIEETVLQGIGGTEDLLFYSPQRSVNPTLLENESVDVLHMIVIDETILKKGSGTGSTYTFNLLTNVFLSGGWETPITDINNVFTGGSVATKFELFDSNGNAVPTSSFNCSTSAFDNCPHLAIELLRHLAAPLSIFPTQGNTGNSGSFDLFFRPGGDGVTWVVTVDTTGFTPGCYIFTGRDHGQSSLAVVRFAPFSYSTTTKPFTTILRIGTSQNPPPSADQCRSLAGELGLVVH